MRERESERESRVDRIEPTGLLCLMMSVAPIVPFLGGHVTVCNTQSAQPILGKYLQTETTAAACMYDTDNRTRPKLGYWNIAALLSRPD